MFDYFLESNAGKQGIFAQHKEKSLEECFDTEMPGIQEEDEDGFLPEIRVIFNKIVVPDLHFQTAEVVLGILPSAAHEAVGTCSYRVKNIRNYSQSIVITPTRCFGNKHLVVGGHRLIKLDAALHDIFPSEHFAPRYRLG